MCVLLVLERRGAALEGEAGEAAVRCARGSELKIMGLYNRFFKRFLPTQIFCLTAHADSRALEASGVCV